MKVRIVGTLTAVLMLLVGGAASGQLITAEDLEELQGFKALIYTGITGGHAQGVAAGTAQPAVYTEVGGGDVPVTYYHYRVPRHRLDALAAEISLPPGLSLAPIRILKFGRPQHYISLTVYEVAGERSGTRAEWTTYVTKEGDPKPRVMMLETWTSEGSIDPVDLASDPVEHFEYSRDGDIVTADIVAGSSSFSSSLKVPHWRWRVIDAGWNAASDIVYWRNGVADLQSVNGLISNRGVALLFGWHVDIDNQTRWAAFVERRPRWVVLFEDRIDTAIQPWVNATDPSLPLDPDFREQLLATKATVFSANELARASAISDRMAEPLVDFFVEPSPPSIYLNFEILPGQREALAAAIPLPEGFELAQIRPIAGRGKRYFLSLNIYETVGIASGLRAEWSVYVTKEGDPAPRYMVIEAQSNAISLDPVNLFTEPAEKFDYTVEKGVISVDVRAPGTSFQATIPLPEKPRYRTTTLDWAEANNLIYWGNGVADKIYYNGLTYDTKLVQVPRRTVTISDDTAWAQYLRLAQVLIYQNQLEFIASPWNNLNQLEEEVGAPE